MVVGAFPIAKLSVLLIKQISKPIANICKERAKNSPFFRTYVCMPPAQFYNWCEVKAKMWILNLGRPVNIPVLSQEMAIELGANLLGESVIFIIGAGLLVIEYNRQSNKETAKEAKREEEMKHITNTLTELFFTVQHQQTQLKEMERYIHSINSKPSDVPPKPPGSGSSGSLPPASTRTQDTQNITQNDLIVSNTPHQDKGLIIQSLDYIQLDVFSSFFQNNNQKTPEVKHSTQRRREPALLSKTLYNIENNFKSMF